MPDEIDTLPAQLGVYEIGDADGHVVKIGYAGGRSTFGLRSALLEECSSASGDRFRIEFTHGYLTRYEELLMLYAAEHGVAPTLNDRGRAIGRLHIAAGQRSKGV